jgi:hypothetical protein
MFPIRFVQYIVRNDLICSKVKPTVTRYPSVLNFLKRQLERLLSELRVLQIEWWRWFEPSSHSFSLDELEKENIADNITVIEVTFAVLTVRKLLLLDMLFLQRPPSEVFYSLLKHYSFCYEVHQLQVVY